MLQSQRTNQEWISALSTQDQSQEPALIDLRDLLLRAALFTLARLPEDMRGMDEQDRLDLAEDCAQDALRAVLDHLGDFRGESKFTTWAYKFGVNIALTRARRERWKGVSLDALSEEGDALEWMRWKDGLQSADSEMPAMQAEAGAIIQAVIRAELTGRQRQVLRWIAFEDVPMDVVVERLETNRNAVYKLLHDARMKIKRRLAAHGYDVDEILDLFQPGTARPAR